MHRITEIEMLDLIKRKIKNINEPFSAGKLSTKLLDKKRNYGLVKRCLEYLVRSREIKKYSVCRDIFDGVKAGIYYARKGVKMKKYNSFIVEEIK